MTTDTLTVVRRRFTLVALVLPAVVILVAVVAQVLLLPAVPAVVATHWGWTGEPDGFAPAWTVPLVTAVLGLGLPATLFGASVGGLRRGDHGFAYRLLGAVAFGLAVLIGGLGVATLGIQVGRTDADAALPVLLLPGVLLAAAAAGWIGWAVQPRVPWHPTPTMPAAEVPVRAGERVVWMQGVTLARGGAVVLWIAFAIGCLAVLPVVFFGDLVTAIISGLVVVVLFVVVATTLRFHVRVDPDGLTAVSAAGWPRVHVPTQDIVSAEVVQVSPFGEFGGWGIRWPGGGRQGVVLRAGEGLLVRRRDGRTLTVTVDDAATAAGLLSAYAALTPARRGD